MKRSSRNRLTEHSLHLYPQQTLFDKIARAVCQAGCLPRKELYESWEVARQTRRRFRGGRIVDLASGHGLLAQIMLILDRSSSGAIAVDSNIPASCSRLHDVMKKSWPHLEGRVAFIESDLKKIELESDDIVVSAHACGSLSDTIIDRAVAAGTRLSILPCCHNLKTCDPGDLLGWMDAGLAIDTTRVARLKQNGYSVVTRLIPDDITPKNRLLIAEPIILKTKGA